jgi:photosystem II stability/assembly factor-like uncharacterized protein
MGRHLSMVFLLAVLVSAASAQTWEVQDSIANEFLCEAAFADALHGWAVGTGGMILHTSDGDASWEVQESGTHLYFYGVAALDSQNAWAVGMDGVMAHTTDGGVTWDSHCWDDSQGLFAVDFVGAQHGWAVGWDGLILHTADGGTTWDEQSSGTMDALWCVDFVDTLTGWAAGTTYGTVLHTIDGGATWTEQNSGAYFVTLRGISFFDANHGWAVGQSGTIRRTSDGGQEWVSQDFGTVWYYDVVCINANRGWVVTSDGRIKHTNDGGETWTRQYQSRHGALSGLTSIGNREAWAVGDQGMILHYSEPDTNTPPDAFVRLLPVDEDTLIVGTNTGDSVRFAWSKAHDYDGDDVHYLLHLSSRPDIIVTSDTSFVVHFPVPLEPLDDIEPFHWIVLATDGHDTTAASNQEGLFYLDTQWQSADEPPAALAGDYSLRNYPNPFNPSTTIRFGVSHQSNISLDVFDVLGQRVTGLYSGTVEPGIHTVMWNCPTCPSGIYLARLQAGGRITAQRMLLMK